MTNNLFDLTFSFNSGRGFLSGRFDINTNDFQFNTYALKSDLSDYLKITYFSASVTLPANGSKVVSIPFTTPSGYRIVTVINARAEGSEIVTFNAYNSGSNIMVNTRNVASAQSTQTVHAGVLFVKS